VTVHPVTILASTPVGELDVADNVHLPQRHRPAAFPAVVLAFAAPRRVGSIEARRGAADQGPVPRVQRRHQAGLELQTGPRPQ
jgi:hypothetical protein